MCLRTADCYQTMRETVVLDFLLSNSHCANTDKMAVTGEGKTPKCGSCGNQNFLQRTMFFCHKGLVRARKKKRINELKKISKTCMRCSVMLSKLKHSLRLQIHKGNESANQTPPGPAHSNVSCSCSKPENLPHCVAQIFHAVIRGL